MGWAQRVETRGAYRMTNIEKYNKSFMEIFEIDEEQLNAELIYQSIQLWDSVGHMGLMAAIEEQFEIMMEIDDIVDFSSYDIGKEILAKYDVQM